MIRTALLIGAVAAGLTGCASISGPSPLGYSQMSRSETNRAIRQLYGQTQDGSRVVPAVNPRHVKPENIRQVVDYESSEPVGTIVVDPYNRFLYLIQPDGKAMRYGVGVGRSGMAFSGTGVIRRKAEWPSWTPTPNMIKREPEKYGGALRNGLPGGVNNPLGARALYLYRNGRDTLYRIHGTNEEWSIGSAASSGCIRMLNHDVIDLHQRVPTDTRVVVLGQPQTS